METPHKFDLSAVAKNLELPVEKVRSAVELLEAGNTIPFITRYRKEATGGLSERQLRDIKHEVTRQTSLSERKAFILKSIENQGKLSEELRKQIEAANQSRQIEDLYHPFKPRKTSLAETARQQGLEPLARDILEGHQPDIDLASRATDFVRVDRGLTSVDDVISGVQHILAERFSEHLQLRSQLRDIFWRDGTIKTELIPIVEPPVPENTPDSAAEPAGTEPTSQTPNESTETLAPNTPEDTSDGLTATTPEPETMDDTTSPENEEAAESNQETSETPSATTEPANEAVTVESSTPAEANPSESNEPPAATESMAPAENTETKKPKKKKKKKKKEG